MTKSYPAVEIYVETCFYCAIVDFPRCPREGVVAVAPHRNMNYCLLRPGSFFVMSRAFMIISIIT